MSREAIDLDALEELAKAATPGPWRANRSTAYGYAVVETPDVEVAAELDAGDAAFIAAADPSTVLALIARVREAEGRA